ncbi:MAG: helix-turn-helix protein [Solirubrobacterales bacterium]|nr:helix-turn-helix protein [Solirubrobacterales bacterium]
MVNGMELDALNERIARVVRERRRERGATLAAVADDAGLSRTILSRIENGHGNPSIETLFRIGRALELPLSAMLEEGEEPRARVIRARTGAQLQADSGMTGWLVHAQASGHHTEVYEIALPAGTDQRTAGHQPGTRELVFCVTGRLRVGPIGAEVELRAGDAAWFEADAEHHYVAVRATRALNWIVTPARG